MSNLVRKRRLEIVVGRRFANPLVRALHRLGVQPRLMIELETTGRRSGLPRTVPLSAHGDATGFWLIAQHGRGSGWVHNIEANPQVRVLTGGKWRSGQARLVPDDDVRARVRTFSSRRVSRALVAATFRAMETDPVSVRVDFD